MDVDPVELWKCAYCDRFMAFRTSTRRTRWPTTGPWSCSLCAMLLKWRPMKTFGGERAWLRRILQRQVVDSEGSIPMVVDLGGKRATVTMVDQYGRSVLRTFDDIDAVTWHGGGPETVEDGELYTGEST